MQRTSLFLIALLAAYVMAAVDVDISNDNGKLEFGASTKFFDVSLKVVNIVEMDSTFDPSAIDWETVGGDGDALNSLSSATNWCTSFSYSGIEEYTFTGQENIELLNGKAGEFTCTRDSGEVGFLFARMAQAAEAGRFRTNVNGQDYDINVASGAWKIDLITEWDSAAEGANFIVAEVLMSWDVNEAAFTQSIISNGDIPDIDVDTDDEGCVKLTIEGSTSEYCYPDVPLKLYDQTTGTAESPPADSEVDVDGEFTIELGQREGVNEGTLRTFIVMAATDGNDNVKLPVRAELDPQLYAEDGAATLLSWMSWLSL